MTDLQPGALRKVDSHEWEREEHEHYVEPEWCSARLFDVEKFQGAIWDPACGFGRIISAAHKARYIAIGTDIVHRGFERQTQKVDFLQANQPFDNVVSNPPFDIFPKFATQALDLARNKVALIWLVRTLPAARWLEQTPLKAIYLLTPRPSMPPGQVIARGEKPGGGKQDFCWLVWEHGYVGAPEIRWLRRDPASAEAAE